MKHTFFVSAKIEGGTHFLVRNDAIDFENSTKLYKPSYLGSEFVKFGSQNVPFRGQIYLHRANPNYHYFLKQRCLLFFVVCLLSVYLVDA